MERRNLLWFSCPEGFSNPLAVRVDRVQGSRDSASPINFLTAHFSHPMKRFATASLVAFLAAIFVLAVYAAKEKKDSSNIWTDPAGAVVESAAFAIQGEYNGEKDGAKVGIQVAALDAEGSKFYTSIWNGGLPGAGWDTTAPATAVVEKAELDKMIDGFEKAARLSPHLALAPPEGATVLFDGAASDKIKGEVNDGMLWAGAQTTGEYGDFKLHVEFRLPFKPSAELTSQDRGNSGLYLQNRYEVQVLDSFGVPYDREQLGVPAKSDPKQWCGSLYKFKLADVGMCLPPLTWQTYDIDFTAPKFGADGKKTENARLTVELNGVKIHDDVELPKGTGAGGGRAEVPKGPIIFQGHGNPVAFRNVWILEK